MARETSEEFAHRAGLVRAAALDGSVSFVPPEMVAIVEAREHRDLQGTPEQLAILDSYERNYWTHHDGTSNRKDRSPHHQSGQKVLTGAKDPSDSKTP